VCCHIIGQQREGGVGGEHLTPNLYIFERDGRVDQRLRRGRKQNKNSAGQPMINKGKVKPRSKEQMIRNSVLSLGA